MNVTEFMSKLFCVICRRYRTPGGESCLVLCMTDSLYFPFHLSCKKPS